MNNNEIITLQFGNYSNHIGAHWWNIQEASFVYNADDFPEINYDVLFREGKNLKKEVTYTPRLLLTDVKGSLGGLPLHSDLYEETHVPELTEENVHWPQDRIQIEMKEKHEKNEFLTSLEKEKEKMDTTEKDSIEELFNKYDLNEEVKFWSDYLATKFHPRSITLIPEYQYNEAENSFNTFSQGLNLWKTDLFVEEWTDKCRAYAEECDYLQGFQVLFDCCDGFSGLSHSALTYLQDEHTSKSVFAFPTIAFPYMDAEPLSNFIRIVNSVLSFAELPELSSAFVPLSTKTNGWSETETPRNYNNLIYNNKLPYQSSAILASFLDSISMTYRLRKNITRLSALLSKLSPCGRKLLTGTLRLPFPVPAGVSILESLENLDNVFWTPVTPNTNVTVESAPIQHLNLRGLSSFSLLPSEEKRTTNPAYSCQSIEEMFLLYLNYCSSKSEINRSIVSSYNLPLKVPTSYPCIFSDKVTRFGCIMEQPSPFKLAVVETPVMAGLHNCSSASFLLEDLCTKGSAIKICTLHRLTNSGLEELEYSEAIEKLLSLNENYS